MGETDQSVADPPAGFCKQRSLYGVLQEPFNLCLYHTGILIMAAPEYGHIIPYGYPTVPIVADALRAPWLAGLAT